VATHRTQDYSLNFASTSHRDVCLGRGDPFQLPRVDSPISPPVIAISQRVWR
jgi:hypothetical protein